MATSERKSDRPLKQGVLRALRRLVDQEGEQEACALTKLHSGPLARAAAGFTVKANTAALVAFGVEAWIRAEAERNSKQLPAEPHCNGVDPCPDHNPVIS